MARAPDERVNKAYELYKQGMKLVEIASQLNIPDGTVRRWKSTYKWDSERSEKKSERSVKTKKKKEAVASEVESVMSNDDLNDKQRLFCMLYVKYRNKVKAYQKAYDCSYTSACGNANKVWKNIEVQREINRLLDDFRENIALDINDLFQWYLDIARADINDFVMINDNMIKIRNGSEIDGTLISEIKEGQYGVSVKLHDKQKAMSWLSEHIGLANEEQKARLKLIQTQIDNINKDKDNGEGGVIIVNNIPRPS